MEHVLESGAGPDRTDVGSARGRAPRFGLGSRARLAPAGTDQTTHRDARGVEPGRPRSVWRADTGAAAWRRPQAAELSSTPDGLTPLPLRCDERPLGLRLLDWWKN